MQFCSHAVFYLKKALKRYGVKMLFRGWLFSQKKPSPRKLFFLQMGPRHLQCQESILSEYITGGGGESPGVLNLSSGRIPNISFFEMQTFLRLQYIERAADLIWGAFTATFSCTGQDTVVIHREPCQCNKHISSKPQAQ